MIYIATSWSQCGIAVQLVLGARRRRLGSPTFSKRITQVRQQHNLHTRDAMDLDFHFDFQDIDIDTEHMASSDQDPDSNSWQ